MTTESSLPAGVSVLVTGAGGGIGAACARTLAQAGAAVHVVDLDGDAATSVAAETGGTAHVVDLAHPAAVAELPHQVDVLVNNAGLQHVAPIEDFPIDRFTRIQQVMVTAPFLLIQRCLPYMRTHGWGRIGNISSVHGLRASPNKLAYMAAKHGLEGLSKVAALKDAAHGITSNCVNPGYVRTALLEGQIDAQAQAHGLEPADVEREVLLQRSAIKLLIAPTEVAAVVRWLCGSGNQERTREPGIRLPSSGPSRFHHVSHRHRCTRKRKET